MSLVAILKAKGQNGFGYSSTAEQVTEGISLKNKNILVTGCNSGLGKETARVLAMRGARIYGTARTREKAQEALNELGREHKGLACELADPKSIKDCISAITKDGVKLDVIICNAGIMALPKREKAFGYELQFFTNHIGHFILVDGLLSQLTDDCRVVVLSSSAHNASPPEGIQFDNLSGDKFYKPWTAYGQSKFANILFAKELARRFTGTKRTANALHPGVIRTRLARNMNPMVSLVMKIINPLFLKSVGQGAATQCFVATHPSLAGISGEYFADCNLSKPRPDAENPDLASKLWDVSEKIATES